jgi:predicted Zn-dependent protease
MAEKSARRLMLEDSLAADPRDAFLRYGLAMQCLREGDTDEGRARLQALLVDDPENQIAAYQQLGQSFLESRELDEARRILAIGIEKARTKGDLHAAAEMQGFMAQAE